MSTASSHSDVREQFSQAADNYVGSHFHSDPKRLQEVVDLAQPRPVDRVLDAATGTGNAALALAPHVRWLIGLDLTPAMLARAAATADDTAVENVTWIVGDAHALPFLDASFDLYVARAAPHHFADVPAMLREAARVLRPGGRVALIDCSPPEEVRELLHAIEVARDPSHVRSLTIDEWRGELERAGLIVERADRRELMWRFSDWMGTMNVEAPLETELAARLESASGTARALVRPEHRDGELWHAYWHALIRARKQPAE